MGGTCEVHTYVWREVSGAGEMGGAYEICTYVMCVIGLKGA